VEHVGRDGRSFALRTGRRTVAAAALVLALGLGRFTPRQLGLPDEQRFLDRGLVYRMPPLDAVTVRRVVIIGGGDSAVDTALSLQERHHVTLVHRRRDLRAHGRSLERLMDSRVDVVTDAEVVELCGKHHLESVVLSHADDSAQELPTDLLLVSIGQIPDLAGVRTWDITLPEPHIGVSPAMETALAGVFAAGDYTVYPGKVKMIATAVAEGSTAAASVERYLMTPAA
jgi:thioredoxin reductase (NADPH)